MTRCPQCGEDSGPKFRHCGYCGAPLVGAAVAPSPRREVRKTVTVVFVDLQGSTLLGERLDAEALHEVKRRYFDAMAAEITRHGGRIEKYIGDAIMAVFGLPRAREDDALRAVRAAAGMQAALAAVNRDLAMRYGVALANRTGVNTGEVVARDDPQATEQLATGDAVNVAARLEQAAPQNQIYLGASTLRLVRDAVDVGPVEPLEVKGKSERIGAYRLVAVSGIDGNARRVDTPIVGRDADLARLDAVYREACAAGAARLVTLIGDAGLGKSRLVHAAVERVADRARVLRGRCLSYGEGITFWPLMDMVRQAAGIGDADSPADARGRLLAAVGDADVSERLASVTGLTHATFPLGEINWAARRFFELQAADAPLVVVVDDIHWAESAFLDLLEHVRDAVTGAPILLLATARHDLLEVRPDWGAKPGDARLVLQPLDAADAAQVVANLLGSAELPPDTLAGIVDAAEGNPLYVEQMLSMLIDSRALQLTDGRWVRTDDRAEIAVPPTIHALVEARLDQLDRDLRAAVEPASVIGVEFSRLAFEPLLPEALRPALTEHLATLTRKQFIRPAAGAGTGLHFRFHHQLVRDIVYRGMLKRVRAMLHVEFVRWADRTGADRRSGIESEEVLGYHLEQAYRYLLELGPPDERAVAIGADGARRLAAAGGRAFARGDMHAAVSLYRRTVSLLAEHDPKRLALLALLGEALMELGDFTEARAVLVGAEAAAARAADEVSRAAARLVAMFVELYSGERGDWGAEALRVAGESIPVLEQAQAHDTLATAWRLVGLAHGVSGRYGQAGEATDRYMAHARRAGNERLVARSALGMSLNLLFGPTPVTEAITRCEAIVAEGLGDRVVEGNVRCVIAQLRAMNGEFEPARSLYQQARRALRDLGQGVVAAATGIDLARVELLAGDLPTAEHEVRADYEFLKRKGETYILASIAALLARIVRGQHRDEEALELSLAAERAAAPDDLDAQAMWRSVRAPIIARAGQLAQAEALAFAALDLADRTEAPILQAEARMELAAVLQLAGRDDEAREAIGEAIARYARKGDVVSAARSRAWAERIDTR